MLGTLLNHYMLDKKKKSKWLPVTEVEKAAVIIWVLIFKAKVRPATQTVISYTQLLRHRRFRGFSTWEAKHREVGEKVSGH